MINSSVVNLKEYLRLVAKQGNFKYPQIVLWTIWKDSMKETDGYFPKLTSPETLHGIVNKLQIWANLCQTVNNKNTWLIM